MGRGQVSLFVIIGVVLLIIVGLAIFLISSSKKDDAEVNIPKKGYNAITYFIDTCMDSSLKKSTIELFEHGFFLYLDESSPAVYKISEFETRTGLAGKLVPYYLTQDYVIFPLEIELSSTYSNIFKNHFSNCVKGIDAFGEQGFTFEKGEISVKSTFNDKDVLVEVNWPLVIIDGDIKYSEQKFSKLFEYPIKEKYLLVKNYVDYQAAEEEYFQMGYLAYLSHVHNFLYEAFYLGENYSLIKMEFPDFEYEYGDKLILPFVVKA